MRNRRYVKVLAFPVLLYVICHIEFQRNPNDYSYLANTPMRELVLITHDASIPYILTLNYHFNNYFKSLNDPTVPAEYVTVNRSLPKSLLTFSDLTSIEDDNWVSPPYRPEVYRLFPLPIDASKFVYHITKGRAIHQVSSLSAQLSHNINPYNLMKLPLFRGQ